MNPTEIKNIGLRGVTVADTRVSLVDGEQGTLLYRGYSIQDLAAVATYEEVAFLLLMGRLPTQEETEAVRGRMARDRRLPPEVIAYLRTRRTDADSMDVLQGAVAVLADHDPDLTRPGRPALVRAAMRLTSRLATLLTTWRHLRKGRPLVIPDSGATHAGAFMQMLLGRDVTDSEVRLMDTLLILHAEHTFNASTFAARQVASTRAHLYAAVSAAVGALGGKLHGGANARVMRMLLEIGEVGRVEPWIRERIAAGQRVMGLGHAVYRTEDPRAGILRGVAEQTLTGFQQQRWLELAREVEVVGRRLLLAERGLALYPNVDFYSGPILYSLGIPTEMFPAFFAVSRVVGWCAHVIEEQLAEAQPKATIYRPRAYYVGRYCSPRGCMMVPREQRGYGCPCGQELEGCHELEGEDLLSGRPAAASAPRAMVDPRPKTAERGRSQNGRKV